MLSCIVCIDAKNGISKNNSIPWHIKDDMHYFKMITSFHKRLNGKNVVIMGRNTYENIGMPLSNRINIVLSKTKINHENVLTIDTIENALKYIELNLTPENIFVIGGKSLYEHFINNNLVENIYINKIEHDYDCDIHLNLNLSNYKIDSEDSKRIEDTKNNIITKIKMSHYKLKHNNTDEHQYLNIMKKIKEKGHYRNTRNGYTYSLFGEHMSFDLSDNKFPLLTTKKMAIKNIFRELIFFIRGETNSKLLENQGCNIWKDNTTKEFIEKTGLTYDEKDMGAMYGFQWRHFNAKYIDCHTDYSNKGIDQLKEVIELLQHDKYSRRILMTTYNPQQAKQGVLYPCHGLTVQFGIEDDNKLSCHMYQRSGDWFLGIPFNIASYAFLTIILCKLLGFKAGKLYMSFGDVHLYEEHMEAVETQLKRNTYEFPKIHIKKHINSIEDIENLTTEDYEIIDYNHHEQIKAQMIA